MIIAIQNREKIPMPYSILYISDCSKYFQFFGHPKLLKPFPRLPHVQLSPIFQYPVILLTLLDWWLTYELVIFWLTFEKLNFSPYNLNSSETNVLKIVLYVLNSGIILLKLKILFPFWNKFSKLIRLFDCSISG